MVIVESFHLTVVLRLRVNGLFLNVDFNGLNVIVTEAREKGIFRDVVVGANKVTVSHLQYADDTIFFGDWNKENAKSLLYILKCFEDVSGLKVNYNKSKIYGIGVNEEDMAEMARWMRCGIGDIPFTYLGLPIGKNMRRGFGWGALGGGVWSDIVLIGGEIKGMRIEFYSSFRGILGDGRIIRFSVDRWVDNWRLCDRFPRLFHLDMRKEGCVRDKGLWVNDGWWWKLEWVRSIRGRVNREFEELLDVVQNIVVLSTCKEK
ncbi:hypothetical protein Tco_0104646 [Tanacetum coccineum]